MNKIDLSKKLGRTIIAVVISVLLVGGCAAPKKEKQDPFFDKWKTKAETSKGISPATPKPLGEERRIIKPKAPPRTARIEEIKQKPLPKRTNVVITRDPYFISTGCIVVHSIEEALQVAHDNGEEEAFIIGGGQIYEQAMPFIQKLYLSEIETELDGDVFFPEIDPEEWNVTSEEYFAPDERNAFPFTVRIYERKDG